MPVMAGPAASPLPTWPGTVAASGQPCSSACRVPTPGAPGRTLRCGQGWGSGLRAPRAHSVRSSQDGQGGLPAKPQGGAGQRREGAVSSCLLLFLNYKKTGNRAREGAKFKGGPGKPPWADPWTASKTLLERARLPSV